MAFCLLWLCGTTAHGTFEFEDVAPESKFYLPVDWAVDEEITNGTSSTTFSPGTPCRKKHILTFLWRATGKKRVTGQFPYDDVSPESDFGLAAHWAYCEGLDHGNGRGSYKGELNCTRAMAVTYLWLLSGRPAADLSLIDRFVDVFPSNDYAKAVAWAVETGITNGLDDTHFSPDTDCTRGQIVTFLYRYFNNGN